MKRQDAHSASVRFLLAEDHPRVRMEFADAVAQMLPTAETLTCKDLPEAQVMLQAAPTDVLVVDLGLPSGSGLQLIRSARMLWGDRCHALVLTVTGNDEFLLRAVACGACGVIYKSDPTSTWHSTLEEVLQGGSPGSTAVAHAVLARQTSSPAREHPSKTAMEIAELVAAGYSMNEISVRTDMVPRAVAQAMRELYRALWENVPRLTPRELELIRLLGKGNGFKQCAALMGVSEATTKTLAARAYAKLGAGNLQTAIYEAHSLGLLT